MQLLARHLQRKRRNGGRHKAKGSHLTWPRPRRVSFFVVRPKTRGTLTFSPTPLRSASTVLLAGAFAASDSADDDPRPGVGDSKVFGFDTEESVGAAAAVGAEAVALCGSKKELPSEAKESGVGAVAASPADAVVAASNLHDAGSFESVTVLEIGEPAIGAASVDVPVAVVAGVAVVPAGGTVLGGRPPSILAAFNRKQVSLPATTPSWRR